MAGYVCFSCFCDDFNVQHLPGCKLARKPRKKSVAPLERVPVPITVYSALKVAVQALPVDSAERLHAALALQYLDYVNHPSPSADVGAILLNKKIDLIQNL